MEKSSSSDNSDSEYEVERILQYNPSKNAYFVKWKGYSNRHNTWEPRKNLTSCEPLLRGFEEAQTKKHRTTPRRGKVSDAALSSPKPTPTTTTPPRTRKRRRVDVERTEPWSDDDEASPSALTRRPMRSIKADANSGAIEEKTAVEIKKIEKDEVKDGGGVAWLQLGGMGTVLFLLFFSIAIASGLVAFAYYQ